MKIINVSIKDLKPYDKNEREPMAKMKKYQIIYADPPWSYQNGSVPQGGVNAQYPTMKLEDIKKLPVNSISTDDSVNRIICKGTGCWLGCLGE